MTTTVNDLTDVGTLASSDHVLMYSANNADARKLLMTVLETHLESNMTFPNGEFYRQTEAPTATGYSITLGSSTQDVWLFINPAAAYAAGTVVLPASPTDGQELIITSTEVTTTLTLDGNGKNVYPASTVSFAAITISCRFKYDDTLGAWNRLDSLS